MAISEMMQEWAGYTIEDYLVGSRVEALRGKALRLDGWRVWPYTAEDTTMAAWEALRADPGFGEIRALVVGRWDEEMLDRTPDDLLASLIAEAPRLPGLEALFVGDIPYSAFEISWIEQTDVAPVMMAFPKLRAFGVRGGKWLEFKGLEHARLEELVVQTGGISSECVRQLMSASLPALRRLELWLGEENYGRTATVEDLAPLFCGKLFPKLSHLSLANCELADEIAQELAASPVLEGLEELDLSMGTLTDAGAEALLKSPAVARLKRLNLGDNYLLPACEQALREGLPGVELVLGSDKIGDYNPEEDRAWRFVTHGE